MIQAEPRVLRVNDFEGTAWRALDAATSLAGLPSTDWDMVRIGERAVFRRADLLAKVTRSPARLPHARREVRTANWLSASGVPVERPLADAAPDERTGLPVSLWHAVDGHWTTPDRLGEIVRLMHGLAPPDDLRLPQLNPFPPNAAAPRGRRTGCGSTGTAGGTGRPLRAHPAGGG